MAVNRPPKDITPAAFFAEWLPAEFATAFGSAGSSAAGGGAVDLTIRVALEGDAGGKWDLELRGGKLGVVPGGGSAEPEVTVMQTVADWKAIAVGESGAVDLAPPQASPMDILFLDPSSRQVLKTVKGTIRFEVTGYNGRTWSLTVKLGPQPVVTPASATISVDAESYAGMLARTLSPPQAFFTGKVKLSGDVGLAMQLGTAMLPRFS